jgi:predicted glycosyl hydrolase (DUF1957 family)
VFVTRHAEKLAKGQLAELHFGNRAKCSGRPFSGFWKSHFTFHFYTGIEQVLKSGGYDWTVSQGNDIK